MRTTTKTLLVAVLASGLVWSCGKDDNNDKNNRRVVISELGHSNNVPGTRLHPNVHQHIQPNLGMGGMGGFQVASPNYQIARIPMNIGPTGIPSILHNQPVQVRGLNTWNQNVASLVQTNPAAIFGNPGQMLPGIGPVNQLAFQPRAIPGQALGVQGLCYLPNYYGVQSYQSPWNYFSQACRYNRVLPQQHTSFLQQQNNYLQLNINANVYNQQIHQQLLSQRFNSYYRYTVPHYNMQRWQQFYNPYRNNVYGGFGYNNMQQQQIWQQAQSLAAAHAWGNTVYDSSYLNSMLPPNVTVPQARNGIYSVPFADGRMITPQNPFTAGNQYLYMLQCRQGRCPVI